MSWLWLVPTSLACVAVIVAVVALRRVDAETTRLRASLRTVPVLAREARSVHLQAARAAAARQATGDALRRQAPH